MRFACSYSGVTEIIDSDRRDHARKIFADKFLSTRPDYPIPSSGIAMMVLTRRVKSRERDILKLLESPNA